MIDDLLTYLSMIKMTSHIGHKLTGSEPELSYVRPDATTLTDERAECWVKMQRECEKSDCHWRRSGRRGLLRKSVSKELDDVPYLCEHIDDVHFAEEGDLVYHHQGSYVIERIVNHPPILPTLIFSSPEEVIVCFTGFDPYYDGNTPDEGMQYYCAQEFSRLPSGSVRLGILNLFNFIKPFVTNQLLQVFQSQSQRLTFTGFSLGGAFARLLAYEWHVGQYPPSVGALRLRTFGEIPIGDSEWVTWWRKLSGEEIDALAIASARSGTDQMWVDPMMLLPHKFEPVEARIVDDEGWIGDLSSEMQDDYAPEDYDLCSGFRKLAADRATDPQAKHKWHDTAAMLAERPDTRADYEYGQLLRDNSSLHSLQIYQDLVKGLKHTKRPVLELDSDLTIEEMIHSTKPRRSMMVPSMGGISKKTIRFAENAAKLKYAGGLTDLATGFIQGGPSGAVIAGTSKVVNNWTNA